jgi:hypothetical protein
MRQVHARLNACHSLPPSSPQSTKAWSRTQIKIFTPTRENTDCQVLIESEFILPLMTSQSIAMLCCILPRHVI